ncbi:MAG: hypothetical protein LBU80_03240 [Rikenellaceae bacterium]|jgi:hypothetical protein|nr:hypothetical protein [Rikenellaceae bacterium]
MLSNPEDVEMILKNGWNEKTLCASAIEKTDRHTLVINLQQPYGAILTSLARAGRMNYDKDFIIRNAFELLDNPGEFYFDRRKQRIFYYTEDEDMDKAEAVAPVSERLIRICGTSVDKRAKNLAFEGITFSHDAWKLMEIENSYGFGGIHTLGLAIKYIPDGNWHPTQYNSIDVPPGTIDVKNGEGIEFVRNRFVQLNAATAVSYVNDAVGGCVEGNFFNDLSGNAIMENAGIEALIPRHHPRPGAGRGDHLSLRAERVLDQLIREKATKKTGRHDFPVFFVSGRNPAPEGCVMQDVISPPSRRLRFRALHGRVSPGPCPSGGSGASS